MAAKDINRHLQRKFLIVVDGTPESHAALRFAARRAHGTGGKVRFCWSLSRRPMTIGWASPA